MESDQTPRAPLPERSLNRQVVLEEDEYTAGLSHIIARDFFPSLVHLDATNEYLDAIHSKNPHLINASVRRLEELNSTPAASSRARHHWQTPSQTPYGGGPSETPAHSVFTGDEAGPSKRLRYDDSMRLDAFQARYTSEDNSSFTQILDDENRKRKERWAWAWDAQKRVEGMREKMVERRERMLIESAPSTGVREKFVIEVPTPAGLITDGNENVEGEGVTASKQVTLASERIAAAALESGCIAEADVMAPKKGTRSAGVDGWKFKTRNSLMFSPDADVSPYDPSAQPFDTSMDPKSIKHGNTRLPEQDDTTSVSRPLSAPSSPTRSRIDAAITGTPYRPRSPSNTFSLVPNLPSPTPSELGPAAVKQLMTWGTLTATPRIISQADDDPVLTPSTPFHIPKLSAREVISNRLSSRASKSLRGKAELLGISRTNGIGIGDRTPGLTLGKKGSMAPPTWTPKRTAGALTPAAKRLLDRTTMGAAAARRAEAMERISGWEGRSKDKEKDINRIRWTPTPSPVTRR